MNTKLLKPHYYRSTHFFALNSRQELHQYYYLFPVLFSRNNLSPGALAQARHHLQRSEARQHSNSPVKTTTDFNIADKYFQNFFCFSRLFRNAIFTFYDVAKKSSFKKNLQTI